MSPYLSIIWMHSGVSQTIFVTKSIKRDQYLVSLSSLGMFTINRYSTTIGHKHFPKSRNSININLVCRSSTVGEYISSIEDTNLVSTPWLMALLWWLPIFCPTWNSRDSRQSVWMTVIICKSYSYPAHLQCKKISTWGYTKLQSYIQSIVLCSVST